MTKQTYFPEVVDALRVVVAFARYSKVLIPEPNEHSNLDLIGKYQTAVRTWVDLGSPEYG